MNSAVLLSTARTGDPLVRRACSAHFRTSPGTSTVHSHPSDASYRCMFEDRQYVVLLTSNLRVITVYRIRPSGLLKHLRRWPRQVEDCRHDVKLGYDNTVPF